jgi:hypothetical protein
LPIQMSTKSIEEGSFKLLVDHNMLAHWSKKLLGCKCKYSNIFIAIWRNTSLGANQSIASPLPRPQLLQILSKKWQLIKLDMFE